MEYYLSAREVGIIEPRILTMLEKTRRAYAINNLPTRVTNTRHTGPILSLALASQHGRYLLSGGGDAGVHLYDCYTPIFDEEFEPRVLGSLEKPVSHEFAVSGVGWFPFDTGIFTTCSMDHCVKAWDTHQLEEVCLFDLDDVVYAHAMSPCAQHHSLIAAASANPRVRLCDLRSGGFAQTLAGHTESILSVQWSPTNEFIMATGSQDQTIRLWDIRRSLDQCLETLDNGVGSRTRIRSHMGSVNGLIFTDDGRFLLSFGHDSHIGIWDAHTFRFKTAFTCDTLKNSYMQTLQLSMTSLKHGAWPPLLFCPSDDGSINVFDIIHGGQCVAVMKGHFGKATCVVMNQHYDILYSGSNDMRILSWMPQLESSLDEEAAPSVEEVDPGDQWSDDD